GRGADIDLIVDSLAATGFNPFGFRAGVFSTSENQTTTGNGGNIRVNAREIYLSDGGTINTALFFGSQGRAGDISINTSTLDIRNRAYIATASQFGVGAGGTLDIVADRVALVGLVNSLAPGQADFTGLSATTFSGRGGSIRVTAGEVT